MNYLQGYYYELIKVNAQCRPETNRAALHSGVITLPECFRLAESKQGNPCAERIVEWGDDRSNSFEPDSTGYCLCYNAICTEELSSSDNGEHLVRFIPEGSTSTTQAS